MSFYIAFINKKCASHFRKETANEKKVEKYKSLISNSYMKDKTFNATLVNRAPPSLHGGSLELMFTVQFILKSKGLKA